MKVIFVDKPFSGDPFSDNPSDGWITETIILKVNQTFQEWFKEIKGKLKTNERYEGITGLYIYDVMPCPFSKKEAGLFVRYAYIR